VVFRIVLGHAIDQHRDPALIKTAQIEIGVADAVAALGIKSGGGKLREQHRNILDGMALADLLLPEGGRGGRPFGLARARGGDENALQGEDRRLEGDGRLPGGNRGDREPGGFITEQAHGQNGLISLQMAEEKSAVISADGPQPGALDGDLRAGQGCAALDVIDPAGQRPGLRPGQAGCEYENQDLFHCTLSPQKRSPP